jgi:hypothetical protein
MNSSTKVNPAIKISASSKSSQKSDWISLSNTWAEDIEDSAEAKYGESWVICGFRDIPSFLFSVNLQQLIEYAEAIDECYETNFPVNIYTHLCKEEQVILAPSNIALFGDGSVKTDADLAKSVAEAYGGLQDMVGDKTANENTFNWTQYGKELREIEGYSIIDGYAALST